MESRSSSVEVVSTEQTRSELLAVSVDGVTDIPGAEGGVLEQVMERLSVAELEFASELVTNTVISSSLEKLPPEKLLSGPENMVFPFRCHS